MNNASSELKRKVLESVQGNDKPLGKKAPGMPFVVVAFSYLGVLIAVLALVLAIGFATTSM